MSAEHLQCCDMSEHPLVKYLNILDSVKIILLHCIEETLGNREEKIIVVPAFFKLLLALWCWIFPPLLGFFIM